MIGQMRIWSRSAVAANTKAVAVLIAIADC